MESKFKLPKQWRHWCMLAGLRPVCRRGRSDYQWFYLVGRGYHWRVNCYAVFERGDDYASFDRWALCDIDEVPLPRSKTEFLAAVRTLLESTNSRKESASVVSA